MRGLFSKAADGIEEAIVEGPHGRRREGRKRKDGEGTKVQLSKQRGRTRVFIINTPYSASTSGGSPRLTGPGRSNIF